MHFNKKQKYRSQRGEGPPASLSGPTVRHFSRQHTDGFSGKWKFSRSNLWPNFFAKTHSPHSLVIYTTLVNKNTNINFNFKNKWSKLKKKQKLIFLNNKNAVQNYFCLMFQFLTTLKIWLNDCVGGVLPVDRSKISRRGTKKFN